MLHGENDHVADRLRDRQTILEEAPQRYGRRLTPEEYWWLGVGLAAVTLAEVTDRSYAVGRVEQLVERMGHKGVKGDWLQRFVEELAELNAEGLLWPVYRRSGDGPVEPAGVQVHQEFGPREGYFLALAHLGVALALHREKYGVIDRLAAAIGEMVDTGLTDFHEQLILEALQPYEE